MISTRRSALVFSKSVFGHPKDQKSGPATQVLAMGEKTAIKGIMRIGLPAILAGRVSDCSRSAQPAHTTM